MLEMMEGASFEEDVIPFNAGDLLVACSDGITEAMNAREVQFGEKRLAAVVKEYRETPASELIEPILAAVKAHVGSATQMDDMTLVVVKRA